MTSKPIELPPEVAKAFVRDMKAFFKAGGTGVKADEIAGRQARASRLPGTAGGADQAASGERYVRANKGSRVTCHAVSEDAAS
ncbi:MAG: hypothetical protein JO141_25115 [Bradyrhizobium sp.]|nr:hypothetical protein [Bradyrhizobium sp.]